MGKKPSPKHAKGTPSGRRNPEPSAKYGADAPADDAEGTPAWIERAASRHEAQQQRLAHMFDGARDAVQHKKQSASDLFAGLADEPDDEVPQLSIFDEAAQAYEQRQRQLGSMFGDAVRSKEQERASLQQMFGDRPGKPRRR